MFADEIDVWQPRPGLWPVARTMKAASSVLLLYSRYRSWKVLEPKVECRSHDESCAGCWSPPLSRARSFSLSLSLSLSRSLSLDRSRARSLSHSLSRSPSPPPHSWARHTPHLDVGTYSIWTGIPALKLIMTCPDLLEQNQHSPPDRCRANVARIRQPSPDSGLGFTPKVRKTFEVSPSSLGSGVPRTFRCRANVAHIRQSRPDSGLDFKANVLNFLVSSLFARKRHA